jgi:hypothetical protein
VLSVWNFLVKGESASSGVKIQKTERKEGTTGCGVGEIRRITNVLVEGFCTGDNGIKHF